MYNINPNCTDLIAVIIMMELMHKRMYMNLVVVASIRMIYKVHPSFCFYESYRHASCISFLLQLLPRASGVHKPLLS